MSLQCLTASKIARMVQTRTVGARELARETLCRIGGLEPRVGAFLRLSAGHADRQALAVDSRTGREGPALLLAGVPVAVKDNICTAGIETTCASRMLEHFIPFYSATVIRKLAAAGAVLAGKTNLDEFAIGSTGEHSAFQQTCNPWNGAHVPGGSSSGSAAAVASGEVPLALGSDTGGSVRTPASWCGVVGLKPTYGAVSRFGLVAFAPSLEQIGVLARTVDDAALLFSVISGADREHDATSRASAVHAVPFAGVKGLRLGVPDEYFGADVCDEVRAAVEQALRLLASHGAHLVRVRLPSTRHAPAAYQVISAAEASSNLARYDGVKYGFSADGAEELDRLYELTRGQGFGGEVKRRVLLGTMVLSADYRDLYLRAAQARREITRELEAVLSGCDVLVTPTTPFTAPKFGETGHLTHALAVDRFTVPANLAGLPAVSVPCGFSSQGLPVGMQVVGPKWSESRVLGVAAFYERAAGGFRMKEPCDG